MPSTDATSNQVFNNHELLNEPQPALDVDYSVEEERPARSSSKPRAD